MHWEQSLADLKSLPFNFPPMTGHLWFIYPLIGRYLIIQIFALWLEMVSANEERIFPVFLCIKEDKTPGFVMAQSKLSFGMYLMHLLFMAPIAS